MNKKKLSQEDREKIAELTTIIIMHGSDEQVYKIAQPVFGIVKSTAGNVYENLIIAVKDVLPSVIKQARKMLEEYEEAKE